MKPDKVERIKEQAAGLLKRAHIAVTPRELARAKMLLQSIEAYSNQETWETGFFLGTGTVMKDLAFVVNYSKNIMKVRPEDVQRVAQTYLRDDNYTFVSLMPRPGKGKKG